MCMYCMFIQFIPKYYSSFIIIFQTCEQIGQTDLHHGPRINMTVYWIQGWVQFQVLNSHSNSTSFHTEKFNSKLIPIPIEKFYSKLITIYSISIPLQFQLQIFKNSFWIICCYYYQHTVDNSNSISLLYCCAIDVSICSSCSWLFPFHFLCGCI